MKTKKWESYSWFLKTLLSSMKTTKKILLKQNFLKSCYHIWKKQIREQIPRSLNDAGDVFDEDDEEKDMQGQDVLQQETKKRTKGSWKKTTWSWDPILRLVCDTKKEYNTRHGLQDHLWFLLLLPNGDYDDDEDVHSFRERRRWCHLKRRWRLQNQMILIRP